MCVPGLGLPLLRCLFIRQTKLNGPGRAFQVAVSHKTGACGDTAPWRSQRMSREVFFVLGLEVMGQVHCTGRATGPVGDDRAPFVKGGSHPWGLWSEGQ